MFFQLNLSASTFRPNIPANLRRTSLIALAIFAFSQVGFAQNLSAHPTARLISESSGESPGSRPRQVFVAEDSASLSPSAPSPAMLSLSFDDASTIERRAFERTNEERVANGLLPLVWDAELCRMARVHSENMARLGFFAHETPDGLRLKDRARANGIQHFRVIAENIAYNKGYEDPGSFAVERWMISAGHRENILYIGFQASAIGSYVSPDGSVFLTQVFINR